MRREKSILNAHEKHRSQFEHNYKRIDEIVNAFRDSGGLNHCFQHYKLWSIMKLLEDRNPKSILEFGTGSSTLIFADYIKKRGGRLMSVDEDDAWAKNTLRLLGDADGVDVQVQSVGKIFNAKTAPPEMKYDMKFNEQCDLVFVDGPSFTYGNVKHKGSINSNVFELPFAPDVIVVDGRKETAIEISKRCAKSYDFRLSDLFSGEIVSLNYNYLSTFIKK